MTRTSLSAFALLLAVSLLPSGCHRTAPVEKVTAVDSAQTADESAGAPAGISVRSADGSAEDAVAEDAVRPDACEMEVAGAAAPAVSLMDLPPLSKRVTDLTGKLTPECVADLNTRLQALEDGTGAQVAVLLVPDLQGDFIEAFANRMFHISKLGRAGVDDGVLLVAALRDRRARIEVGYGLEGAIPDAVAGDLLRNDLKGNFAAGRYNAGVSRAVDDLSVLVRRAGTRAVTPKAKRGSGLLFLTLMLLLSVVLGAVAEGLKLRWRWRLLAIPAVVDAVVLVATALHLTLGYRLLIPMVPISLGASLAGIPLVRYPRKSLQWVATCAVVSLILLAIGAAASRSQGGMHLADGWVFAACLGGCSLGSLLFVVKQLLSGAKLSRTRRDDWDRSTGSSSDSSSPDSSSSDSSSSSSSDSSDSGSLSGDGGDSGGGGADTSW